MLQKRGRWTIGAPSFCKRNKLHENYMLDKTRNLLFAITILLIIAHLDTSRAEQGVLNNRTIKFSGLDWKVKSSAGRVGPGANFFSDRNDNVWVDDNGHLHLKIAEMDGKWQCAEVISVESFGFGTYRFYVSTNPTKIDKNVTFGLFTWSDASEYAHREIDVECGNWGNTSDENNAQFVVQPYQPMGHLVRYKVPEGIKTTIYSFLWQSNAVTFKCTGGYAPAQEAQNALVKEWKFSKPTIPVPGDENVLLNLWLCTGHPPLDASEAEVEISKFEFEPLGGASLGFQQGTTPTVEITNRPTSNLKPGPTGTGFISGKVAGIVSRDCRIIVYAYGDKWYIQPRADSPNTSIQLDGSWKTVTHGGTEYAALLVKSSYLPPATTEMLPDVGEDVLAVAKATPKN